jgi:hypothetical protein
MGSRKNFYVDQHVAFRVERAAFPARSPHPLIGNIFRSALWTCWFLAYTSP